jgi:excisionase family DNA binding protein
MNRPKTMIMTAGEVAAYLRCHPTTIYRMLRAGTIPAFKVGYDWRFHRASIDQWIGERTNRVTADTHRRIGV